MVRKGNLFFKGLQTVIYLVLENDGKKKFKVI